MYKVIISYVLASLVFVGVLFSMTNVPIIPADSMDMSHSGGVESCVEHCFVQALQNMDVLTLVAPAFFALLVFLFVLAVFPVLFSEFCFVSVRLDRQRARMLSTQKRE